MLKHFGQTRVRLDGVSLQANVQILYEGYRMRLGSTDSIAAILPDPIVTHGHVLKMFDRAPRESETSMHAWLLLHGGHRFRKHYAQVVDNAFPGETSLSEDRPSMMDLDHTEENEAIPESAAIFGAGTGLLQAAALLRMFPALPLLILAAMPPTLLGFLHGFSDKAPLDIMFQGVKDKTSVPVLFGQIKHRASQETIKLVFSEEWKA
jgi:hypothetical protein